MAAALGMMAMAAAPDDTIYKERIAAMLRGQEAAYEPLEAMPGAAAYVPLQVVPPRQRTIAQSALDAAVAYAAANNSAALLVWRDGKLQTAQYFGDTTAATPLRSKSLSKPLGAVAVGRAIMLGKIKSLDQPVSDFITEWKGTPKAGILVRHLLDMRAGLLEQSFTADPDSPLNRAYFDADHGRYLIDTYPLSHAPGTHYDYSNASGELVAILIERATGRRYDEFTGHEVLAKIGAPGGDNWIDRPGGLAHSGCCLMIPAEAWLRLGILLLDDGVANGKRLLPKGYVTAMKTPTDANPNYGMGIWVAGKYTERRGFSGPGHSGPQVLHGAPYRDGSLFLLDGNHDQVVYMVPSARMVIARLGYKPPASPEWDNAVLPNLLIDGVIGGVKAVPQPR